MEHALQASKVPPSSSSVQQQQQLAALLDTRELKRAAARLLKGSAAEKWNERSPVIAEQLLRCVCTCVCVCVWCGVSRSCSEFIDQYACFLHPSMH
jgi:hypothetical protein